MKKRFETRIAYLITIRFKRINTKDVDITVAKPEISLVGGLEQTVEITEDNPNPIVTFKANTLGDIRKNKNTRVIIFFIV